MSTAPQSPRSPQSPQTLDVIAVHIDQDVIEFRDDMKKFMQDFCLDSSEQHREWMLCELLLVAFMRNVVAPSCKDSEAVLDLKWWRGKCKTPGASLMQNFHEMMTDLEPKPATFAEIMGLYASPIVGKEKGCCFLSVFVMDWMVQHSTWALDGRSPKRDWRNEVVMQWFVEGNEESAEIFLQRADIFLRRRIEGKQGEKWGVMILHKAIKTNSYVVFVRMETLWALLLREYCELQKSRDSLETMQEDSAATVEKKQSAMPIAMSLIASSSNWHTSFENHSSAQVSEIAWRLRRIARFPAELLEENGCSMRKVNFVDCEPLYNLERAKKSELVPIPLAIQSAASGGAANASEMLPCSTACTHEQLLKLFNDNIGIVQSYLSEFSHSCGQYEDSASGSIIKIDRTCMFVKTFLSRSVDPFNGAMPAT